MSKDHYVPTSKCPKCGRVHDGAMSASPTHCEAPVEGDLGICAYCGTVNRYGASLQLEVASPAELAGLPVGVRRRLEAARHLILNRN